MAHYSALDHKYSFLWNKYRPAILRLMIDASNGPQEYQFSKHEFHDINPREKGGYAFVMRVHKDKDITGAKSSTLAQDLLVILQGSFKASELTHEAIYEFKFDKNFLLNIQRFEPEESENEE